MTAPVGFALMLASPRCGAKTRTGKPCAAPAVAGKKRCRMHGGAHGSGAPKNNKNAFKHGYYTKEERQMRKVMREYLRDTAKMFAARRKAEREWHRRRSSWVPQGDNSLWWLKR